MVTHRRVGLIILFLVGLPLALIGACDKVPLLAPTGSVITLQIPDTTSLGLNSEMNITATVIENGQATAGTSGVTTRTGAGTPVQNGTVVSFTTTIGRIEPSEARTHNGQVTVRLVTGGTSGTATITAFSGGASTTKIVNIGTAAVKTVSVTTTPQSLPAAGGSVQVSAAVTDGSGGFVSGVPVTFATDRGSVSPSTATTDANGIATATLTTNGTAKVTATAGTVTSSAATVTVSARGLAAFSASPSTTTAGNPVNFTVTPTTGTNLTNVRIDFGDGDTRSLGAISQATTIPHTYTSSGNFTATASATDTTGDAGFLTTAVLVGSLGVTLTPSTATPQVGTPVVFTVGGVNNAQVQSYEWTFSDGTSQSTTSPQQPHTFTTRGSHSATVRVIGVGGGELGRATAAVTVQ